MGVEKGQLIERAPVAKLLCGQRCRRTAPAGRRSARRRQLSYSARHTHASGGHVGHGFPGVADGFYAAADEIKYEFWQSAIPASDS